MQLNSDVQYVLDNTNIEFKDETGKRFTNIGLTNFIRIYKFIPYGISVIKRRKTMQKATKTVKKVTKAPTKKVLAKKAAVKKPAAKPTTKATKKPSAKK